jgi:hypothetical protein
VTFADTRAVKSASLAGDPVLATKVADRLASDTPPGGLAGKVWLPEIRVAIELSEPNPMRGVEILAPVEPYEAGFADRLLAAYLRGEPTSQGAAARRRLRNSRKSSTIPAWS